MQAQIAGLPAFSGFSGNFSLYFGQNSSETGERRTACTTTFNPLEGFQLIRSRTFLRNVPPTFGYPACRVRVIVQAKMIPS
jgi:hypothetical protein